MRLDIAIKSDLSVKPLRTMDYNGSYIIESEFPHYKSTSITNGAEGQYTLEFIHEATNHVIHITSNTGFTKDPKFNFERKKDEYFSTESDYYDEEEDLEGSEDEYNSEINMGSAGPGTLSIQSNMSENDPIPP